ncbi:MAG: hypothetical protein IPH44_20080 [Myxococcales bacterium]|nr:hypothetical protein [Myxococcales bacterium]
MTDLPDGPFNGWHPWTDVLSGGPPDLEEVGAYLLARFPDGAPTAVDPTDSRIFYIGETHGPTRTLRARLTDFGRSAGFLGRQENGHYAAWEYPKAFKEDVRPERTDPSGVYVALRPFPGGDLRRATRGVYPGLIEAIALWRYTAKHGELPRLNNSGRGHDVPARPVFEPALLAAVLVGKDKAASVAALLQGLATAFGYSATRRTWSWKEGDMLGLERPLGGGLWLQIGWHPTASRVGIWVAKRDDEAWFGTGADEGPATTEAEMDTLIDRLWQRWHMEH